MRIATLQGELRAIHLRAHLATRAIRSAAQVARYDELRGYTAAPPELATKPIFMALDCLYVRAVQDLRARPLYVRRNVVEDVLDEQDMVLPVRRLHDHGLKALAGSREARL